MFARKGHATNPGLLPRYPASGCVPVRRRFPLSGVAKRLIGNLFHSVD